MAFAVALGIKTHKANENSLLMANLEALTDPEEGDPDPEKGDGTTNPEISTDDEDWMPVQVNFPPYERGKCPRCGKTLYSQRTKVDCFPNGKETCTPSDTTSSLPHICNDGNVI